MSDPVWVGRAALGSIHAESLAQHGGLAGLRDEGLLESALARAMNPHSDEGEADILALAACYGVALAKNHPCIDGNKRAAFVAMRLFAARNGFWIEAEQGEATAIMIGVAAGELDPGALANWLRAHVSARR